MTKDLFVKDVETGTYLPASKKDVIRKAKSLTYNDLSNAQVLNSPGAVRDFLALRLSGRKSEVFVGLFLSNQNRLLSYRELFQGTLGQTAVHPREVVRTALDLNAGAIIFAHNHPSGLAEPSHADRVLTDTLRDVLKPLDIRVLDHLVVTESDVVSFAERGFL